MDLKRKRSLNYTHQEISLLLELVEKNSSVIEDKRSGGLFLARKREVWDKIRRSFNSVATSGIRTVEQLKVLYDNKKQRARKVLAKYNIQLKKPRSCSLCPIVSEEDFKVLNILKNQETQTPINCDSDQGTQTPDNCDSDPETQTVLKWDSVPVTQTPINCDSDQETQTPNNLDSDSLYIKDVGKQNNIPLMSRRKKPINQIKRSRALKKKKRLIINNNNTDYKLLYFKRKCHNALLEKKKLYQDIRFRQIEHNMFIAEHNLKMKHMAVEHNINMGKIKVHNAHRC